MFSDNGVHQARGGSRRRDLMIFILLALLMLMAWAIRTEAAAGSPGDIAATVHGVPDTVALNRSFEAGAQVPYSTIQADPGAKAALRQIRNNLHRCDLLLQQATALQFGVPSQETYEQDRTPLV